ncbi:SMI1/KNR4 family protein [Bacillus nitratireducens]|uniref:SMI1/KNR4 family protein n=1 Tax=Bacillus nitratireducens TaxID=2026193 RepID=UPI002E1B3A2C|nr:SMI1/KNR4 family protein [Bacillus nitratireducens]
MNQNELIIFIQDNSEEDDFTGGVSEEIIKKAENQLGIKFPDSYKWFLAKYGSGGIFGVDILGCGKASKPAVISNTESFRDIGLPHELVIIENCDEFVYCLDTSNFIDNECLVVYWDRSEGYGEKIANNFYDFLSERLIDAKENWEWDEDEDL